MSSPNNTTFLEKHSPILYNKLLHLEKYELETKYVKEELQYWKTENAINPSESKTKKI